MNEERMKILNMLSEGKITSEEADKLLSTIETETRKSVDENSHDGLPRYFYIHVDSNGDKAEKVDIKVPMALIKAGVNLASLMSDDMQGKVDEALSDKGIKFKLSDIKKQNLDELVLALRELEVNVDGGEDKVKIYCS
ncbi:MAG: hypothetical protein PF518_19325 [Spirochaetaceae bacterium]|jgi:hypothetical protein|nr:hypothetical protein [Spirochaetaceae bacterium]